MNRITLYKVLHYKQDPYSSVRVRCPVVPSQGTWYALYYHAWHDITIYKKIFSYFEKWGPGLVLSEHDIRNFDLKDNSSATWIATLPPNVLIKERRIRNYAAARSWVELILLEPSLQLDFRLRWVPSENFCDTGYSLEYGKTVTPEEYLTLRIEHGN